MEEVAEEGAQQCLEQPVVVGWHGAPKGAQPAVVSAWIALHPL